MGKSPVFERIKRELLAIVRLTPIGRVVTVPDVAASLNIPPRHAAYIISQLTADEKEMVGSHRVVPRDGRFPSAAKRSAPQIEQLRLLAAEGVMIDAKGLILEFEAVRIEPPMDHAGTIWADEV